MFNLSQHIISSVLPRSLECKGRGGFSVVNPAKQWNYDTTQRVGEGQRD